MWWVYHDKFITYMKWNMSVALIQKKNMYYSKIPIFYKCLCTSSIFPVRVWSLYLWILIICLSRLCGIKEATIQRIVLCRQDSSTPVCLLGEWMAGRRADYRKDGGFACLRRITGKAVFNKPLFEPVNTLVCLSGSATYP